MGAIPIGDAVDPLAMASASRDTALQQLRRRMRQSDANEADGRPADAPKEPAPTRADANAPSGADDAGAVVEAASSPPPKKLKKKRKLVRRTDSDSESD